MNTTRVINREQIDALSKHKKEPSWLTELRLQAFDQSASLEYPIFEKTKIERWNLTSYGEYIESETDLSFTELPTQVKNLFLEETVQEQNILIQHNSNIVYCQLQAHLQAQGVIFTSLETAIKEHEKLVKPYFMQAIQANEHRLAAWHAALWNGGVFLYVPKNVNIEIPIQAVFYMDNAQATFAPHVLLIAEANSQVQYVDHYLSDMSIVDAYVHNGISEVFVKPEASVTYASIHHLDQQATDMMMRRAIVENNGRIEWIIGEVQAGYAASETTSILQGHGSTSDTKVICVGNNKQKINVTTKAVHFGKYSDSQMSTRTVMRESATAIVNGITKIEKGATKANGEQTERVLMLSPQARGDVNPILLIDEDDVTAGHAASAGQVNAEQVYYMMSRGIPRAEVENLIIHGFLTPVIEQLPSKHLQQLLTHYIERKLEQ